MNNVEMLQAYNYNLMAALTIEAPVMPLSFTTALMCFQSLDSCPPQNVPQAMIVLRDILDLQCTTTDLEKVPHLVYTIRKVSTSDCGLKPRHFVGIMSWKDFDT